MRNYKRILVKLSGEILQGEKSFGIDNSAIERISSELLEIHNDGIEIGIVVGGGNFFRGASNQEMLRFSADDIGMLATVQNSIALADKFREMNSIATIFTSRKIAEIGVVFNAEKAISEIESEAILIFAGGTGNPFFTTDTAAILRALEINADIVIKGTKVDGIYDKDPVKYSDANLIKRISFDDYISKNLKVMDLTAISLAKEFHLPIKVFNIKNSGSIKKAICEENFGSIIS